MEEIPGGKKLHFRHLLYFSFRRGQKAIQAVREINEVYGEGSISPRTAREWYAKFKAGTFDFRDVHRTGRPLQVDEERLKELVEEDDSQSCQDLGDKLDCSRSTVRKHLTSLGFEQKEGKWVPRKDRDSAPGRSRSRSPLVQD